MNKLLMTAAAVLALSGVANARAAPHAETRICEGRVETSPYSNPGWFKIDDCSFDGNTSTGKVILDTCGIGNLCRIKSYGIWALDYYVKKVISVHRDH
jgi:hypothetical protein